ncbi:hypothetical protein K4K61_007737 [Colletotrichum sp. SAR11_59]|nr:hypothetical protein K4K61_007737 [Colletotrichum sp. SAR11_59]
MALVATVLAGIVYFAFSLFKARSFFRRLQKDGIPMPPHHPILGHLGLMLSIMISLPRDVMPTVVLADQVRRRYPHLDKAFYLDMWPFTGPMLMIISPDLMRQATQGENSLPKVAFLKNYIKPLSGGHDLVSMEGDEWRRWRDVFRPAFSRATELVPNIVETICVFRDQLVGRAQGNSGLFQLHHSALNLAMDMSGKALWNHDMNTQRSYNDMADAIVSQLRWLLVEGFMPFASLNFIRPLVHKYNGFRMERYIAGVQHRQKTNKDDDDCVISRAISKVRARHTDKRLSTDPFRELGGEAHFNKVIKSQMRFLLLAGYDTTGSTITYVLHILSQHPEVLARDAWRPFEKGPRACMGSELAMVEIKAVIMLVAREFDFTPAYQEWEASQSKQAVRENKIGLGVLLPGSAPKHVNGDRVYQTTGGGGSHPADGYPCRVRFAPGV